MAMILRYNRRFRQFLIIILLLPVGFLVTMNMSMGQFGLKRKFLKLFRTVPALSDVSPSDSLLWIIPSMNISYVEYIPPSWTPPTNWTVYVPDEYLYFLRCSNCYRYNAQKVPFVQDNHPRVGTNNAYTKMPALLRLIELGARGILMTTDLTSIDKSISRLIHDDQPDGVAGLEYFGTNLTLDTFHYHYTSHVDYSKDRYYRLRYRMKPLWTVAVRCRQTRDDKVHGGIVLTDSKSPPIFSSIPNFSVDTFSDSYFDYDGFWAMIVTYFPRGIRTQIWSLWAQRMLQEVRGEMALTSLACPKTTQVTAMGSEIKKKLQSVLKFVREWSCPIEHSFFTCASILGIGMVQSGYIVRDEMNLVGMWIRGLRESPYKEPKRLLQQKITLKEDLVKFPISYYPAMVNHPDVANEEINLFPNFYNHCKTIPRPKNVPDPFLKYALSKPSQLDDISLIIFFFSEEFYPFNMPLFVDMYFHHFTHIFVCGPNYKMFSKFTASFKRHINFIETINTHGFVITQCITRTIMMNLDVKGYITMSDDSIMNTWSVVDLPKDKFWFQKDVLIAERNQTYVEDFVLKDRPWVFWTLVEQGKFGINSLKGAWEDFDRILMTSNKSNIHHSRAEIVTSFLNTLEENSGSRRNFFYQASDFFYFPALKRPDCLLIGDIFVNNNVFLEIATPTLIYGLNKLNNVHHLSGHYMWYAERAKYQYSYSYDHQFQHPLKLSLIRHPEHAKFLCYGVLPRILHYRTSLPSF